MAALRGNVPKAERLLRPPGHGAEHVNAGGLGRHHRAKQAGGQQGGRQTDPQHALPPGRLARVHPPLRPELFPLPLKPIIQRAGGIPRAGVGRDRGRPLQRLQIGPENLRIIGLLRHVVQCLFHGVDQLSGRHLPLRVLHRRLRPAAVLVLMIHGSPSFPGPLSVYVRGGLICRGNSYFFAPSDPPGPSRYWRHRAAARDRRLRQADSEMPSRSAISRYSSCSSSRQIKIRRSSAGS